MLFASIDIIADEEYEKIAYQYYFTKLNTIASLILNAVSLHSQVL